ncbi:MAG: hypothetical protein ACO1OG_12925 [Devosia sp.]
MRIAACTRPYHRENLDSEACTAERIDPPTHELLENTIASMAQVPDDFVGYIWTNKIETIGPLANSRFK